MRVTGAWPAAADGRLPIGEAEASRRILGDHHALEDRDVGAVRFDGDQEFRATDAGERVRRLDLEAVRGRGSGCG
ncbi:MAG: hypothetical protein MZV65_18660 [Chromatiales bacterium]|nr:hypothetical protein [Chromatiales bacterium]